MTEMVEEPSSLEILQAEMAATWQWRIDTDPEFAAAMGLLSMRRSTHALDPRSLASFDQRVTWLTAALHRVQSTVKRDELPTDDAKLSYDLYVAQLTDYVTFSPKHKTYLCCINRLEGPQTDLPLMARYIPLKTAEQRQFYLKFLESIPIQLDQVIELLTAGLAEQRTPAQVSLDGVVPQIRAMVDGNLQAFTNPIQNCFPESEADIQKACEDQIRGPVSSAFSKLADFLEQQYIPNLRTEISAVKGYPDGESYYRDCLAFHTTTSMTPQEIHNLGQSEVQRVREAMNAIATQAGYDGRLAEYLEYLRTSPDYEPASAEALCARFRDITGRIAPALLKIFHVHLLPRMPFEVREIPPAQAYNFPAAYYLAGSANPNAPRPGIFYVNTSELKTRRTYESEALALHESIPGHHTQAAIQSENPNLPDFRRHQEDRRYFEAPCRFPFYTGYIEGWGLHSETLGKELGLYERPEDCFGQLSMEALRSCRLVVDTGMHALGWTQEQAVEFMLENTAAGRHDVEAEVKRYITWPGQATAYKVGEVTLRKLRAMAESALQDKFDPRDYYDAILPCGPIPLDTLEGMVKAYIERTQLGTEASPTGTSSNTTTADVVVDPAFLEQMTFANWCKCCIVPGYCQSTTGSAVQ